ncbi:MULTISPECIES: FadR/GntR family transcriptional regulator [Pseudonocardia]|uniref:HTH-type transcriptional regulator LutR n=2 Tax=Pseudonocardia TaxID=1847 RepID=A0A1Y2N3R7_PSEAH|nr:MULTISPECIES: FadR/GntR family transcriptional regulator [Pseudonocardia]OSY42116.1 HTH-type transcriptional regulator LutR [Pseudonocardia autotrophica]TDN75116.1 GntR family transcriptional regulator [Pseudonocardia autotrophica]BBF99061.1 GntR family transcriptional regulator [Pseudonocardia autotrophica]GEC23981.1 GntR family transcriptional regulator [Pseudonocardia saturnea]
MPIEPRRPATLQPLTRPRLYEQLVERLLEHITEHRLGPGDRLPPERELAGQLGVSRASVVQALVALEVQGVIDVRHGDGAVIREVPADRQVLAAVRSREHRLREVIEAREALEVRIAALAAQRRTEQDLRRIEGSLDAMADDIAAGGRGIAADEEFHAAVTAAAHSGLLATLMGEIAGLVRESRIESLSRPGRPGESLAGHRAVLRAIRAGDPIAASAAMGEHITAVSDVRLGDEG